VRASVSRYPRPSNNCGASNGARGFYAISATFLQGREHVCISGEGRHEILPLNAFSDFQGLPFETRIGYSIYVFQIGGASRTP
jgi:hypothetical protein